MKSWRIHFGWFLVTVLSMAVTSRMSSRRSVEKSPEPLRPTAGPSSAPSPAAPPISRPRTLPEAPVPGPTSPRGDPTEALADKIRAMLSDPRSMDDLRKLLAGVEDRGFKLKLLKEALLSRDEQSAYTAMYVLRTMKGRDVAEMIESFLAAHGSEESGVVAVYSLGELGDPGSVAALYEALRSGNDQVRLSSAAALLKMGYRAPADQILADLAQQFESTDGALRRAAIDRIGQLAVEGGVPILAQALKDSNGDVRLEAVRGFSALGKQEYLPLLQPLTKDPIPAVAAEAQETIQSLKGRP